MDSKILIVIVVAAIAVVGVAAFFLLGGNGNNDSQYTLLDSNDNISVGMVIEIKGYQEPMDVDTVDTVTSVADGTVTYTEVSKMTMKNFEEAPTPLNTFAPGGSRVYFDYTDPDNYPEGITVTVDGNKYTINGTYALMGISYEAFTIVYDGENVSSVSGKYLYKVSQTAATTYEYKTTDGKLYAKMNFDSESTETCSVDKFYEETVTKFDKSQYSGMEIKERNGKYGGVSVTIYTLNGTYEGQQYKNVEMYTYHSYMIHAEGTFNQGGEDMKADITVTIKKA